HRTERRREHEGEGEDEDKPQSICWRMGSRAIIVPGALARHRLHPFHKCHLAISVSTVRDTGPDVQAAKPTQLPTHLRRGDCTPEVRDLFREGDGQVSG